jgi:predicted RNA-binding Zn-ribbon protein involved in translation (DUF1610 family)
MFKKCPKCGSRNINTISENFLSKTRRLAWHVLFFITILFMRAPKKQLVCRECGFSWEAR